MLHRTVSIAVLLTLLLSTGNAVNAAEPTKPEPGPENGGLRLRLMIDNSFKAPIDSRTVRLELLNTGEEPVTLAARWDYEQPGDYAAWLRHAVEFTTFPEVLADSAGTTGEERTSPQPEHELPPGGVLSVEWNEQGHVLKLPAGDWDDHFNSAPTLPSDGMYLVRAMMTVVTRRHERLLLASNEQPVIIGGSKSLPKFATGRVLSADPDAGTAEIRLGFDQRIERGDVFLLHHPEHKGVMSRLQITRVERWYSTGRITTQSADPSGSYSGPDAGWLATLERPTDR